MTTKKFSQGKMGRNPFAAKSVGTTPHLDRKPEPTEIPIPEPEGLLFTAVAFPIRGLILGLKSLLVARYIFAHPEEWRF